MADVVLFVDTVSTVMFVLNAGYPSHSESADVVNVIDPNRTLESRFTLVRRTGGPRLNRVADDAQITVESWASTQEEAMALAQLNRALIHQARGTVVDGVTVYRVADLGGPADFPDPLTGQPRCQQTFTFATRGVPFT